MKLNPRNAALVIGALCVSATMAAEPRVDHGRIEYQMHCAICHGDSAKGNGEMRRFLTRAPADLTTMTKRHGGAFPNQLAWDIIDGRSATEIGPHGKREMPIWGQRYRDDALAESVTAAEPEWYVRNRIVALLDYLSRVQER